MGRQYGALSGLAIVLIVLNHAIQFALQAIPQGGSPFRGLIVLQALGVFAVPAFLFISGAFLAYASSEFSVRLIRSNLERILWPYLIWSGLFYLALWLTADARFSGGQYVRHLLVGYPYHFVPLLVFWYATAPIMARLLRGRGLWLLVGVAAYQIWLLVVRYPAVFGSARWMPEWGPLLAPPVLFTSLSDWAIYFPLGFALAMQGERLRPRLVRLRVTALTATALLFTLGILNAFRIVDAGWARFVTPLPLMFVVPTISRSAVPLAERLEYLGRRSYGVYLAHFVTMYLVVALAGQVGPAMSGRPMLLIPVLLACGLGVPLGLMAIIGKVRLTRGVHRYFFGIPPGSRMVGGRSRAIAGRAGAGR